MNARIWLESQREMEVAETLILKPDSVLEYSCFDNMRTSLGNAAHQLFNDNISSGILFKTPTYTPSGLYAAYLPIIAGVVTAPNTGQLSVQSGPHPPGGSMGGDRLDSALEDLVKASLEAFLKNNFGHGELGGTEPPKNFTPCSAMQAIWNLARCKNFEEAWFMTFEDFENNDLRTAPKGCNDSNRKNNWNAARLAAFPAPGATGGMEALVTQIDQFDPAKCSSQTPIKTGLKVFRPGQLAPVHDDAVCLAAGCYYDGSACQ